MEKNQTMPWNERQEVRWLQYTVQPPLGLVKGNYYHAQRRFGESEWSKGHLGELMVVTDEEQRIVYTEFNETTMEGYYNQMCIRDRSSSMPTGPVPSPYSGII